MYGIDPLTEKYPSVSAYTYCMGNPVKLVDVDGCLPQIPIIVGILEIKGIAYLMENYATNHNLKTAGFVINHPIISYNVGEYKKGNKNISTYAGNFQINICLAAGLNTGSEGDYGNAIRHTLWQAILTREYGEEMAKRIGYMHEDGNIDVSKRVFSEMAEADKTIDLLNNEIGRKLSNDNPNADNRTLASKVIKMFYEKGLWIAQSNENGVITIKKNKLTLEQYNAAIEEIKKKGEDGLNK